MQKSFFVCSIFFKRTSPAILRKHSTSLSKHGLSWASCAFSHSRPFALKSPSKSCLNKNAIASVGVRQNRAIRHAPLLPTGIAAIQKDWRDSFMRKVPSEIFQPAANRKHSFRTFSTSAASSLGSDAKAAAENSNPQKESLALQKIPNSPYKPDSLDDLLHRASYPYFIIPMFRFRKFVYLLFLVYVAWILTPVLDYAEDRKKFIHSTISILKASGSSALANGNDDFTLNAALQQLFIFSHSRAFIPLTVHSFFTFSVAFIKFTPPSSSPGPNDPVAKLQDLIHCNLHKAMMREAIVSSSHERKTIAIGTLQNLAKYGERERERREGWMERRA